ncbi:hypothetical protein ACFXO9_27350 [Nocardia tengchongensis]|uniref:hypothetical protein n=1 Tax=Nocardia tengchongensis TaxID=2055889 RepID=UPI00367E6635
MQDPTGVIMISFLALAVLVALVLGAVFPFLLRFGGAVVSLSSLVTLVFHRGILEMLVALAWLAFGFTCYLLGHLLFARRHGFFLAYLPFKIFGLRPLRQLSPAHNQ